jgi:hypothetical protein
MFPVSRNGACVGREGPQEMPTDRDPQKGHLIGAFGKFKSACLRAHHQKIYSIKVLFVNRNNEQRNANYRSEVLCQTC